ncbi:MAG TPA: DUF3830 family protein [Candidatus Dormibacteraeota bacterium]|jgi:hypothetical protein
MIDIRVAGLHLTARLERLAAPRTCDAFLALLPLRGSLLQARWSGESAWVPLGDRNLDLRLGPENATSHPAPGQLLLYPGGVSEVEILFPYGATLFASRVGQLAGNHFATLEPQHHEHLAELGRRVVWQGAQDIAFEVPRA